MRYICAIYDRKTNDIVGNMLMVVRHPAAAIRTFNDAASNTKGGDIATHPEDFDLVQVAVITDEDFPLQLETREDILLTGEQWLALNKTTGE